MRLAQVDRQREHNAHYMSILHMQSLDGRAEDSLWLVVFSCFVKQGLTGLSSQNVKNKQTKPKHQNKAKWTNPTELTRKRRKKKAPSFCTHSAPVKADREVTYFVLTRLFSSAFMWLLAVSVNVQAEEHVGPRYITQLKRASLVDTLFFCRETDVEEILIYRTSVGDLIHSSCYSKGSCIHDLRFLFLNRPYKYA